MNANAGIHALVGTPATRSDGAPGIFPLLAPKQVTLPYLVYFQRSGQLVTCLPAGTNSEQDAVFFIWCFAADYPTIKTLSKAVWNLFNGFTGTLSDGSTIRTCFARYMPDDMNKNLAGTIYGTCVKLEIIFTDSGT